MKNVKRTAKNVRHPVYDPLRAAPLNHEENRMPYASRDQIPARYTWDLSSMYESDAAFLQALEQAQAYPERCLAFQGAISQDPAQLLAFLKLDDEIGIALGKLVNYANRKSDEDTRDSTYQDYSARVMLLYTQIAASQAWFASELLELSDEQMSTFYTEQPELVPYRRALDRIFAKRAHTLSPAEERLLASAADMASQPENIFSLLNDADLQFGDAMDAQGEAHPVTHGSYIPLMMSPDRTLRKNAFTSLYAVYNQFRNTCAATLGAQMKQQKFFADARKYDSTLAASLDGTEVPVEVYTNLIQAVRRNLPAMHKYVDVRRRLLGLDCTSTSTCAGGCLASTSCISGTCTCPWCPMCTWNSPMSRPARRFSKR